MNYDKLTKEEIIKILDDTLGYIDKQEKEIEELKAEIKELNDDIIWWTNRFNAVERDNRELKARIDKAIEYISKHTRYEHDGSDYDYMEWVDIDETNQVFIENILDILQGNEQVSEQVNEQVGSDKE